MTDAALARIGAAALLGPLVVAGLLGASASSRRAERARDEQAIETLARRLPTSDLALSGGARWLRAVSLEEPGAAFADGPATADPDPGGAALAPPLEVWTQSARAVGASR